MKEYPIGATWEAEEDNWKIKVWLKSTDETSYPGKRFETWWVDVSNALDMSVYSDWFGNFKAACKEARSWLNSHSKTRLKRTV